MPGTIYIDGVLFVDLPRAAYMLNLSVSQIRRHVKRRSWPIKVAQGLKRGSRTYVRIYVPAECIYELQDDRETASDRKDNCDEAVMTGARHIFIRGVAEAPLAPGNEFIDLGHAALILNCTRRNVIRLVHRARLSSNLTARGKPNSPILVRYDEVWRYACNPDRIRRRNNYERGVKSPSAFSADTYWSDSAIACRPEDRPDVFNRDYGEFYTSGQAAAILGVCKGRVANLRSTGKLTGYRINERGRKCVERVYRGEIDCPQPFLVHPGWSAKRYWFYLKSEVEERKASMSVKNLRAAEVQMQMKEE